MAQNTPFFEESGEGNFRDNEVTKLSAPVDCAASVASSEARIGSPPGVLVKTQQAPSIAAPPTQPSLTSIGSSSSSDALPCSSGNSSLFLPSIPKTCASIAPASPKFVFSATESASLCSRARMIKKVNASPSPRSAQEYVKQSVTNKKSRLRCSKCQIRIPVTSITCRCGMTFCGMHRYAEEHECTYDFKLLGKRQLELENPKILAAKIAKIN